jgi:hypothetical protein
MTTMLSSWGATGGQTRWLVLYRCEDADPETDPLPPPPHPSSACPALRSAPPPPPAAALAPPPRSHVLRHERCPPPPPAASYSPPEKMRCKQVSNFILEKWYENEKVTSSLSEQVDEPTNDRSMCLIISARCLLAVLQPWKRVFIDNALVLLFPPKSFFVTLFNLFDILFKTSTSEYSSKT